MNKCFGPLQAFYKCTLNVKWVILFQATD